MLTRENHVLQPSDIAARWQCDVEAIYALIKKGVLPAFSTSPPGSKRPSWRILVASVEAYESGRPVTTENAPRVRRPRRDAGVKRFFR